MNAIIFSSSPILGEGFLSLIRKKLSWIDNVSTGDFNRLAKGRGTSSADLIILGLISSDLDRVHVDQLNAVKEAYPQSPIVVFDEGTTKGNARIRQYFQAGVAGYASLKEGTDICLTCIENVISGKKFLSPYGMDWFLGNYMSLPSREDQMKTHLTRKELEIAKLLIEGEKVSVIAQSTNRKSSTISTIKKTIFRKTNTSNIINLKEKLYPN